jgi:triacylglycerol lipase
MKTPHLRRAVVSALAATVLAPASLVLASSAPAQEAVLDPAVDPFYAQPASFAETTPGQVLNSRQVTITGLGVPLPFTSWQVQYVSEDTFGKPQANVATIIKPLLASASPKLVSYQPAIDSLSYRCDPSYKLRKGNEAEATNIAPLLLKGWTVVVPDFLGPDHQWSAAYVEGKGTLDGIRAAENFTPAGLRSRATPVALTGYSGGARGTEFAAELAPTYAPELNIVGAAPGGLAVNVGDVAKGADGGLFAGVYFAAAMGLGRAYPSIGIDELLNDKGRQMQKDISTMCIEQFVATYPFQRIESYTVDGVDPLTLPSVQQVIGEIEAGNLGTPRVPLYLYMATYDELVVTPDADKLVQKYCAAGVRITYVKYPLAEHVTALAEGFPGALSWLSDRFAGKPAPTSC